MNRDRKLIRGILAYTKANACGEPIDAPEIDNYTAIQIHYHIRLCTEAGFIRSREITTKADAHERYQILDLTWQGHEELAKMNNPQVYL